MRSIRIIKKLAVQRYVFSLLLCVFLFFIGGNVAWPQQGEGALTGDVHDASGASVAGAAVGLAEINTGSKYNTISSDQGLYRFPELPPGTYQVTVTAPGFQKVVQTGITISVSDTAVLHIVLPVGVTTQSVTVSADASQLKTETSDVGTTVSPAMMEDLPLPFSGNIRNPVQFLELTPGFTGENTNSPETQGGFKLNGGQEGGPNMILDGASLNFASPDIQVSYGISVEAVREFKVTTNTFSAEYGRLGGGFVNLATKSGTDLLHGSFYDFYKNRALDANSWINNYNGVPRAFDTQNDFGALISGPVFIPKIYDGRNKTFFLFNYEGYRFTTGGVSLNSAPTPAMLNGDFSALLTPTTVNGVSFPAHILYNYKTCTGPNQGQVCQPYPGNKIPQTSEDPVFKAAAQVMPHSTSNVPYFNFPVTATNPVSANIYTVRIDQNIGDKQKLNGSYDYNPDTNTVYYGGIPLDTSGTNQINHYVRLGYDYVLTPTLLNHFNFGFSRRFREELSGEGSFGGNWPTKLGLKGVSDTTFPRISYNYPNGVNLPSDGADEFADNSYQYDDVLAWEHGRQSIKLGLEVILQEFNIRVLTGTSGEFNFTSGPTSGPSPSNINTNSGFGFASFYLGAASNAFISLPIKLGMRTRYYAGFIQDDWKVAPKLTMNLGFRYEIPKPVVEAHNRLSFVDPTLPNPGAGGLPGAYVFEGKGPGRLGGSTPQSTFYQSLAPRIGLAYQLTPSTVIRAGYGIYYTTINVGGFAETESQGFFGSYTYPTPASQQTPAVILSQIQSYPGATPPFINPTVMNNQSPTFIQSRVARPGSIQNWTLDVERQLPANTVVSLAYVGDIGTHLQALMHDPNQGYPADQVRGACLDVNIAQQAGNPACAGQIPVGSPYAGFNGSVAQALRPFPQYQNAQFANSLDANPYGTYTYESLQLQVQKRYSSGLTVLGNYTWSKNITNADATFPLQAAWVGDGTSGALNTYNLKVEKALSEFDVPQSVVMSYIYELPFGKNKPFLSSGHVTNALAGGWQVAGINTYQSGYPLATNSPNWDSGIFAGNLCGGCSRPNVVPGEPFEGDGKGNAGFIFNKSRRLNPAAFTPAPNFTFGDAPRALNVRQFATLDEDFSIAKMMSLSKVTTMFQLEFFDVANRHSFTGFNTSAGTPGFGQATTTANYRTVQAELKFMY